MAMLLLVSVRTWVAAFSVALVCALGSCQSYDASLRIRAARARSQYLQIASTTLGDENCARLENSLRSIFQLIPDEDLTWYPKTPERLLAVLGEGAKSETEVAYVELLRACSGMEFQSYKILSDTETVYASIIRRAATVWKETPANAPSGAIDALKVLRRQIEHPEPNLPIRRGETPIGQLLAILGPSSHDYQCPVSNRRCVVFTNPMSPFRIYYGAAGEERRMLDRFRNDVPVFMVVYLDDAGCVVDCEMQIGESAAIYTYSTGTASGVESACDVVWEAFARRLTVESPVVDELQLRVVIANGEEAYTMSLVYERSDSNVGIPSNLHKQMRLFWKAADLAWDFGPLLALTTDDGSVLLLNKMVDIGQGTEVCIQVYTCAIDGQKIRAWGERELRFQKPRIERVVVMPRALVKGFLQRIASERKIRGV